MVDEKRNLPGKFSKFNDIDIVAKKLILGNGFGSREVIIFIYYIVFFFPVHIFLLPAPFPYFLSQEDHAVLRAWRGGGMALRV